MDARIVIIGAGIAGASAACHLYENGFENIKLLEARNRSGGRMYSVAEEESVIELGAQWITGACSANSLFNLALSLGVLNKDCIIESNINPEFAFQPGGLPIDGSTLKLAFMLFERIFEQINDYYATHGAETKTTIHDYYNAKVEELIMNLENEDELEKTDLRNILEALRVTMGSWVGGDDKDCCLELMGQGLELPGAEVPVPSGVSSIVGKLIDKLPTGSLKLETVVTAIKYTDHDVSITTQAGEIIEADYVVSTVPLGVLKKNYNSMFSPILPSDKIRVIQTFRAGAVSKLFLKWENPWWANGSGNFLLVNNAKEINEDWTGSVGELYESEKSSKILVAWISGENARVVDSLEDDEVINGIMKLIHKYTGDISIKKPNKLIRNRWTLDPFTLGGYSYPSIDSSEEDFGVLAKPLPDEICPRLLFAGEAVHPKVWSYMHGARSSGIEQAQKIIDHIKR